MQKLNNYQIRLKTYPKHDETISETESFFTKLNILNQQPGETCLVDLLSDYISISDFLARLVNNSEFLTCPVNISDFLTRPVTNSEFFTCPVNISDFLARLVDNSEFLTCPFSISDFLARPVDNSEFLTCPVNNPVFYNLHDGFAISHRVAATGRKYTFHLIQHLGVQLQCCFFNIISFQFTYCSNIKTRR